MNILSKTPLVIDFEDIVITVKHPNKSTPEIVDYVEKAMGELIADDYINQSEYQPECCLPEESQTLEVMYGIGEYSSNGEAGMWDGPHPDLKHMLNRTGHTSISTIFELPSGEPLYSWNEERNTWCKINSKES